MIQARGAKPIRATHGVDSGRGVFFSFGFDAGPGTYSVTVEAPGYRSWQRTGVHAPADQCGRISQHSELTARLIPVDSAGS